MLITWGYITNHISTSAISEAHSRIFHINIKFWTSTPKGTTLASDFSASFHAHLRSVSLVAICRIFEGMLLVGY